MDRCVLDNSTIIKSFLIKRTKKQRIKRDFTFAKYIELCEKMIKSDYTLLTVERYFTMKDGPESSYVDDGRI